MDGHEVCRRLKADAQTREIPVIFVTGQHDPTEETIGLELGAVDFISKPANPAVVRARVKTHLKLKFQADALEQINQTLELRIAERSNELKQAMEHLMQTEKLASLGSMVAGITHELASPLSNMSLSASSLVAHLKKLSQDIADGKLTRSNLEKFLHASDETLNLIERAAERAQTLLLSFKQVSVDQTSERRCRFDLHEIVAQTVRALGPTLKGRPYKVDIDIPPGIMLDSHPGALEQIITNLINNSLAHAFAGRDAGHMFICAQAQDGMLDIVYSDDGIGIPPVIRRRIFDPFFTTKAGKGGSGLGLYTIYNLVTGLFGGTIGVTSQADGGACFTLRLPVSAPRETVSHAEMHAVRPATEGDAVDSGNLFSP
jgi:signal transduction histidine kinase